MVGNAAGPARAEPEPVGLSHRRRGSEGPAHAEEGPSHRRQPVDDSQWYQYSSWRGTGSFGTKWDARLQKWVVGEESPRGAGNPGGGDDDAVSYFSATPSGRFYNAMDYPQNFRRDKPQAAADDDYQNPWDGISIERKSSRLSPLTH